MNRPLRYLPIAAAIAALLGSAAPAQAAVSVTGTSFSYSQSFDSLATTGNANAWVNDSTLPGWSLFTASGSAITAYRAENGGSNTGSFYSFGSTGSTDRALGGEASGGAYFGSPGSGAVAGYIVASFSNASGASLSGFDLAFTGEQWRDGGNTNGAAQTMAMQYGFGSSYATVSWTSAPSFSWTSPVHAATSTGVAVNGNLLSSQVAVNGHVTANWASGQTLWVRWVEVNDVGNDHGLGIDNVSLQVSAVPEPASLALLLAGVPLVWGVARRRRA